MSIKPPSRFIICISTEVQHRPNTISPAVPITSFGDTSEDPAEVSDLYFITRDHKRFNPAIANMFLRMIKYADWLVVRINKTGNYNNHNQWTCKQVGACWYSHACIFWSYKTSKPNRLTTIQGRMLWQEVIKLIVTGFSICICPQDGHGKSLYSSLVWEYVLWCAWKICLCMRACASMSVFKYTVWSVCKHILIFVSARRT